MFLLAIPVYLIALLGLYAGSVKLAAFFLHRTQLLWKHALIFGAITIVISHAAIMLRIGGLPVILLCCWGLPLIFGGQYFASRAQTKANAPINIKTGLLLALIGLGLSFAVFLLGGTLVGILDAPVKTGG